MENRPSVTLRRGHPIPGRRVQPETPASAASRAPKNRPVATKKTAPSRINTLFLDTQPRLVIDCMTRYPPGGSVRYIGSHFRPLNGRKGEVFSGPRQRLPWRSDVVAVIEQLAYLKESSERQWGDAPSSLTVVSCPRTAAVDREIWDASIC